VFVLANGIRDYAWGSTTSLAEFLGAVPTGQPQAELWIGAHPAEPSRLPDGQALDAAIAENPAGLLGTQVHDSFGERLPFLMKVLAVADPLSLQVHPSSERARIGHAREDAAGIPADAPERSYRDPWHKPELLHALTPFEGLAGFRDVARSAELLRLLHHRWADAVAVELEDGPAYQSLRRVVTEMLELRGKHVERLLRDISIAARHASARAKRHELRSSTRHKRPDREFGRALERVAALAEQHRSDPGVLVALLLNNVMLAPGESMYVGAGVIHAHLAGVGVEIMATSDNVLRAGLTQKHRDVEELLRVTDFTPIPPPRWDPSRRGPDFVLLEPPVQEFGLSVGQAPLPHLPESGPRIVLAVEGHVEVTAGGTSLPIRRGQAVFVSDADGPLSVTGDGRVAVGWVPA
jgi:mannose-6-phosphate isomerase